MKYPNSGLGAFLDISEKVVAVAYERLLFTRGSKHSELTGKTLILIFVEVVTLRKSFMRGGCKGRFNLVYP